MAAVVHLHKYDLPEEIVFNDAVAVDTETNGLCIRRDKLYLVQLSAGDGTAHLVQIYHQITPHNIVKLLLDETILKIFHFARFDVAMLKYHLGAMCRNIYCTKIASKIARTNARYHGLKELCRELLCVDLFKQQQCSNWANKYLTKEQQQYAASDVLHLHQIKQKLDLMLQQEKREIIYQNFIECLPSIIELDLLKEDMHALGWDIDTIFAHNS